MNVTVENLGPCRKLVRVEVDAQKVDRTFEEVTTGIQRQANIPGFRPGKAPRHLVLKSYAKQLEDEVKRQLISESYKSSLAEQKLRVVGYPDIEEIQFGRGQPLQFAATVETAPEFELPEYRGLAVKRPLASVTEADIDRALNALQLQHVSYRDLDRPVQEGDFVVVNYKGTSEGKPLTDFSPASRGLTEKENFWIEVKPGSFIPGFTEQLIGAKAGEKRTVNLDFPADFVASELSGKKGVYEVDLVQVKEKVLPPVDDAFAKLYGAENVEKLREGVRRDLQNELEYKQKREIRDQLIRHLLEGLQCDLPESLVTHETRNVVYDLVRENQQRGVPKETIDSKKDEIYNYASQSAKERVKIGFLLERIAEKEGIKVENDDMSHRIVALAAQNQIKPEKMAKKLQEEDGFAQIREQILSHKVLEFLEKNARIEDVVPSAQAQP